MAVRAKVTGLAEIQRNIERLRTEIVPKALGAAAYGGALSVTRDARKLAPDDPSTSGNDLRGSAYTTLPVETSNGQTSEGGFGAEHAIPVHEKTEIRHSTGQAKFLEAAINAKSGSLIKTVQAKFMSSVRREKGANQSSDMPTSPRTGGRNG